MILLSVLHNIAHCQSFLAARLFAFFTNLDRIAGMKPLSTHSAVLILLSSDRITQRAEVRLLHAVG